MEGLLPSIISLFISICLSLVKEYVVRNSSEC
jgi:hypothetical protein